MGQAAIHRLRPKTVLSQVFGARAETHFQNLKVPPGWGSSDGRCAYSAIGLLGPSAPACLAQRPICLSRGGGACVLGAVERAGNALHSARVYLELGRRLAHAHAARQSRPDALSQLVRDRRPAKALTFTLGPPQTTATTPLD